MAAIDKIYGTRSQYNEFYRWIKKNHPAWLKYFYPKCTDKKVKIITISNLPTDVDRYLLNNCPIKFVVDRIKYAYGIDGENNK